MTVNKQVLFCPQSLCLLVGFNCLLALNFSFYKFLAFPELTMRHLKNALALLRLFR